MRRFAQRRVSRPPDGTPSPLAEALDTGTRSREWPGLGGGIRCRGNEVSDTSSGHLERHLERGTLSAPPRGLLRGDWAITRRLTPRERHLVRRPSSGGGNKASDDEASGTTLAGLSVSKG